MKNKDTYITAELVVFGLLILSRIPAFINGSLDAITTVSTIVELGFFIWGYSFLGSNLSDLLQLLPLELPK